MQAIIGITTFNKISQCDRGYVAQKYTKHNLMLWVIDSVWLLWSLL